MADAAFKGAMYPAYTISELKKRVASAAQDSETKTKMIAEIARREAVENGDYSQMTPAERLRHIKDGKATA